MLFLIFLVQISHQVLCSSICCFYNLLDWTDIGWFKIWEKWSQWTTHGMILSTPKKPPLQFEDFQQTLEPITFSYTNPWPTRKSVDFTAHKIFKTITIYFSSKCALLHNLTFWLKINTILDQQFLGKKASL